MSRPFFEFFQEKLLFSKKCMIWGARIHVKSLGKGACTANVQAPLFPYLAVIQISTPSFRNCCCSAPTSISGGILPLSIAMPAAVPAACPIIKQ